MKAMPAQLQEASITAINMKYQLTNSSAIPLLVLQTFLNTLTMHGLIKMAKEKKKQQHSVNGVSLFGLP